MVIVSLDTIVIWYLHLSSDYSPVPGTTSKLARTGVLNRSMNIFPFVASEGRCQDLESGLKKAVL